MIINSTLIFCLVPEIEEAFKGSKIIQILQSLDKKELLFITRSKEKETSLFFSAHPENYRIEIRDENETKVKGPDYQKTNLFSYALGGNIHEIKQVDFDRMIKISCLKKSQLGPNIEFDLIFELTGRNSNLILLRNDGLIIDCLRKVDLTQNRFRQILPGEKYLPPPYPKKRNPFQIEKEKFINLLKEHDLLISEFLLSHFAGFDRLLAEKIIFQANLPLSARTKNLNKQNIEDLWKNFSQTFQEIAERRLKFQIVIDEQKKPQAIGFVPLPFLKTNQKIFCENLNSAVKKFFSQKLEEHQRKIELKRLLEVTHRVYKRSEIRKGKIEEDLRQAEQFEQYKKFGDLLMMNKDSIKKGQDRVKLVDVFHPEQHFIEIPLNVKLSPVQNAQAYFKKYKKAKDALVTMKKRQAETEKEVREIENILERLEELPPKLKLEEIKQKLIDLGFLSKSPPGEGKEKRIFKRGKKVKKEFSPKRFMTKNGWEILVGRNDRENDYLTFKFAQPNDLWFHAQDLPGSHVVLRRKERKKEPSFNDIKEAAQVAAYYSKAGKAKLEIPPKAGKAPIIYTLAKYVKKPRKGKPGLVWVEREKTIVVEPKLTDK
jgi:predicted ribosome quality control (RQC) complex YloA/Tae2 family protein